MSSRALLLGLALLVTACGGKGKDDTVSSKGANETVVHRVDRDVACLAGGSVFVEKHVFGNANERFDEFTGRSGGSAMMSVGYTADPSVALPVRVLVTVAATGRSILQIDLDDTDALAAAGEGGPGLEVHDYGRLQRAETRQLAADPSFYAKGDAPTTTELRAALELIACGLPWLQLGGTAPFMVNRSARVVDAKEGVSSSNAETPPPFPSWGADAGAEALTFAGSVYAISAGLRPASEADLRLSWDFPCGRNVRDHQLVGSVEVPCDANAPPP